MQDRIKLLEKIKYCAKQYESNLKNNMLMIITEGKNKKFQYFEAIFLPIHFEHLTGCCQKINNKRMTALQFYKNCINDKIYAKNLIVESAYATEKCNILNQIVQIDKTAKIAGEYYQGYGIYLQTDKIIGTTNCGLGFILKNKYYIPNTSYSGDIRKVINEKEKVVAVLKKATNEKMYSHITLLNRDSDLNVILNNDKIDQNSLYSEDNTINKLLNLNKMNEFIE